MVLIVDMFAEKPGTPEHRFFSCHFKVWDRLLQIGKEYGWQPQGTLPDELCDEIKTRPDLFKPDYEVEDISWTKKFLAQDAQNLAEALEKYLEQIQQGKLSLPTTTGPTLFRDDLSEGEFNWVNQGITKDFLKNFITFLRKGGFSFCWDD